MFRPSLDLPDHPVIRNMERTGYPDGREPGIAHCPICGKECETIYRDQHGDIFGARLEIIEISKSLCDRHGQIKI